MAVTLTAAALAAASGLETAEATRLLPVVAAHVERYAPDAPATLQNEAVVRGAAHLAQSSDMLGLRRLSISGMDSEAVPTTASWFWASGAAALLSPWRVRRAGLVGETPAATSTPAPEPRLIGTFAHVAGVVAWTNTGLELRQLPPVFGVVLGLVEFTNNVAIRSGDVSSILRAQLETAPVAAVGDPVSNTDDVGLRINAADIIGFDAHLALDGGNRVLFGTRSSTVSLQTVSIVELP